VAFVVQDEWQSKGMGTFLLDYITQIAKQRGVKKFWAKVLPNNEPMLTIFHNSGYKINTTFDGDAYDITYDLTNDNT
jgi:GNAT superfamily N-acetyltransferase